MRVIERLDTFQKKSHSPVVIALGNFDGVHLGHQAIFKRVKEKARAIKGAASVITFKSHPQHVLGHHRGALVLTSFFQKLSLLERSGIENCFLPEFSKEFSELSAEDFVKKILLEKIGAQAILMGADARFGKGRQGDRSLMEKLSKELKFDFEEVNPIKVGPETISSSKIRNLIQNGKFNEVSAMLGRSYSFYGKVVKGSGRGSKLGFPTANLKAENEVLPPHGVYAVFANLVDSTMTLTEEGFEFSEKPAKMRLPAVMNYGVRPTFEQKEPEAVVEVHVLEASQDFSGKTLEVEIVEKIRDEVRFPDEKALTEQIKRDIEKAKNSLHTKINGSK